LGETLLRIVGIAEFLGVSKQRAHQLAAARSFPKPERRPRSGRLWEPRVIERWGSGELVAFQAVADMRRTPWLKMEACMAKFKITHIASLGDEPEDVAARWYEGAGDCITLGTPAPPDQAR
jgi:hypothetical protein